MKGKEEGRRKKENTEAGGCIAARRSRAVGRGLGLMLAICVSLMGAGGRALAQTGDLSGVKICIDPGHGGHNAENDRHVIPDPGTDFWESESNLQKALRLDTLLRARGAWVILTRTTNDYPTDAEPSLSARWALANANNVTWFHSIHSNATGGTNTSVNYTLVLVKENIATRQVVWPQAVTMSNIIGPAIQAKLRNTMRSIWTYFDYTFYGGSNGGFNLGVLNGLAMPGELSEGSFHDFYPETRRLMNNGYCKMEAYALRNAFMQYFGAAADTMGIIAGIQSDIASGKLLNGTRVRLIPGDRVVTGDLYNNGFYMLDDIAPGTYWLRFETPGYMPDSVQVVMTPGRVAFIDRQLVSFAFPSVLTTAPVQGDPLFPSTGSIRISFSKPMDTASVRAALAITPATPGRLAWSGSNTVVTFTPDKPLQAPAAFTVRVDTSARSHNGQVFDANGDGVTGDPLVLTFTTKFIDVYAPQLTASWPGPGTRLSAPAQVMNLTFDEPLQQSSVTLSNVVVALASGAGQSRTLEYAEANGRGGVSVFLPNGLASGMAYRAGYKSIMDPMGNNSGAAFTTWELSVLPGEYTTTVLDSLGPDSMGLLTPVRPDERLGADSVTLTASVTRSIGLFAPNAGSASLRIRWDATAAQSVVHVQADTLRTIGQTAFSSTGTLVRAHIFGDASRTRLRLAVRDGEGDREVSRWLTCDWVGWRSVTWDLELDTAGSGSGNGQLTGQLRFDGIEFSHVQGEPIAVTAISIDQVQLIGRTPTDVVPASPLVPGSFVLYQNVPNPFNPSTRLTYNLPSESMVTLTVHDVLGREVARLVNGREAAGLHEVRWHPGASAASGLYIARLQVEGKAGVVKMMLVK